MSGVMRVTA